VKVVDHAHLPNARLAGHIQERTEKFGHIFEGVKECRITIDAPGPDPDKGRCRVRITPSVPHSRFAINRQIGADLPMAIRESFDAADQGLAPHVRIRKDAASRGFRRSNRKQVHRAKRRRRLALPSHLVP